MEIWDGGSYSKNTSGSSSNLVRSHHEHLAALKKLFNTERNFTTHGIAQGGWRYIAKFAALSGLLLGAFILVGSQLIQAERLVGVMPTAVVCVVILELYYMAGYMNFTRKGWSLTASFVLVIVLAIILNYVF